MGLKIVGMYVLYWPKLLVCECAKMVVLGKIGKVPLAKQSVIVLLLPCCYWWCAYGTHTDERKTKKEQKENRDDGRSLNVILADIFLNNEEYQQDVTLGWGERPEQQQCSTSKGDQQALM